MSVVTGVRSFRRRVGESSGIPGHMSSTPIRVRDLKEFSTHFEASFPGLMERMDTDLTDLDSPLKPLGAAVPKEVRRSSRVSRKP